MAKLGSSAVRRINDVFYRALDLCKPDDYDCIENAKLFRFVLQNRVDHPLTAKSIAQFRRQMREFCSSAKGRGRCWVLLDFMAENLKKSIR